MSVHLEFRRRREALGRSLEEVAGATRIETQYLDAIEHGRVDLLPAGASGRAMVLAYAGFLEIPPEQLGSLLPPEIVVGPPGPRLWAGVLALAALALLGLSLLSLGAEMWQRGSIGTEVPEMTRVVRSAPDQVVSMRVTETGVFRAWVDGQMVLDERLTVGTRREFLGHERIEVELHAAGAARVMFNDEVIAPQGRQDQPRRLLFIDDGDKGSWP